MLLFITVVIRNRKMETTSGNSNAIAPRKSLLTALIRRHEVERLTGLSRSRIYELMKRGFFPKPVSLGVKSVAWLEIEIREWIADRIASRPAI